MNLPSSTRLLCRLLAVASLAACGDSSTTDTGQTATTAAGAAGVGGQGASAGAGGDAAGGAGAGGDAAGGAGAGGASAGGAGAGGAAGGAAGNGCGGQTCTLHLCYPVTDTHPLPCDPVTDPKSVLGCTIMDTVANFEPAQGEIDPTTGATLCCYRTFCGGGRPLILAGIARVAGIVVGSGWG